MEWKEYFKIETKTSTYTVWRGYDWNTEQYIYNITQDNNKPATSGGYYKLAPLLAKKNL